MPSQVAWNQVVTEASPIFEVWLGGRELEWAMLAWQGLQNAGLTSYEGSLDRSRVMVRLLLLGRLYREFCAVAWEEWQEPDWSDWADHVGITLFRAAQLVGEEEVDDNLSEFALLEAALVILTERERQRVVEALVKEFRGAPMLFVSLWATNWAPSSDLDDEGDDTLTLAEIIGNDDLVTEICDAETVVDLMEGKGPAFEWVSEGMDEINFHRHETDTW
jgi:hypothetical protein